MNHNLTHPTKIRDYRLHWTEWRDAAADAYVCEVRLSVPGDPDDMIIRKTSQMEPQEAHVNAAHEVLQAIGAADKRRGLTIVPVHKDDVVQWGDYFRYKNIRGDNWNLAWNAFGKGVATWPHIEIGRPIPPAPGAVEATLVYTP